MRLPLGDEVEAEGDPPRFESEPICWVGSNSSKPVISLGKMGIQCCKLEPLPSSAMDDTVRQSSI